MTAWIYVYCVVSFRTCESLENGAAREQWAHTEWSPLTIGTYATMSASPIVLIPFTSLTSPTSSHQQPLRTMPAKAAAYKWLSPLVS